MSNTQPGGQPKGLRTLVPLAFWKKGLALPGAWARPPIQKQAVGDKDPAMKAPRKAVLRRPTGNVAAASAHGKLSVPNHVGQATRSVVKSKAAPAIRSGGPQSKRSAGNAGKLQGTARPLVKSAPRGGAKKVRSKPNSSHVVKKPRESAPKTLALKGKVASHQR